MPHDEMKPGLSPELLSLESKLTAIQPRAVRFDRDRVMFLAGQASIVGVPLENRAAFTPRNAAWLWPIVSCLSTTAAIGLAVLLVTRPAPQTVVVERVVEKYAVPSATVSLPDTRTFELSAVNYISERNRLLVRGFEPSETPSLNGDENSPASPPLNRNQLRELLDRDWPDSI